MNEKLQNNHHVIAAPGLKTDPTQFAKMLSQELGTVLFDETYRLKNCEGWWLRGGTAKQAAKVSELAESMSLPVRSWVKDLADTRLKVRRTIRTRIENDRLELVSPTDSRWIPLNSIRALDLSLAAEDDDDQELEKHKDQRDRVMRSLASVMHLGTPAGDLLEKISEAPIRNPRPKLFLIGPGDLCWSMDRSTVFLDLVEQRAAQSLANILRFTGILIGSLSEEIITPQTQLFWIDGDLDSSRRDTDTQQSNRIDAIRAWLEVGGTLNEGQARGSVLPPP